jgi:hypothetical protein
MFLVVQTLAFLASPVPGYISTKPYFAASFAPFGPRTSRFRARR